MSKQSNKDRLFTKQPFKYYRRTYSRAEVRWGALILVGLVAIAAWVAWKGQNPDPTLFPDEIPALPRRGEVVEQGVTVEGGGAPAATIDRGPLPERIGPEGWRERNLAEFDPTNLYVKINGREGYYKSFGFERLVFVTLEDEADSERAIDIEAYSLTNAQNALGAFAGEAAEGANPEVLDDGLVRLDQNALYVARGKFYIRCIAGDASEETQVVLGQIKDQLLKNIEGEALPWSYALFLKLGVPPAKVAVVAENAFSFEFGKDVHKAELGGDLEIFVVQTDSPKAAAGLAKQFVAGFLTFGAMSEGFVKDRYLNLLASARGEGRYLIGVRGAADLAEAKATLARLGAAVQEIK